MTARKWIAWSSLVALPVLYVFVFSIRNLVPDKAIPIPKWDTLLIIALVVILERIYHYKYAVSQRHMLKRDFISSVVNLYVTGALTAMIFLPMLLFALEQGFGRKLFAAAPEHLGPLWVQIPVIVIFVSLFRYWMHRIQHEIPFLWELHSYHHSMTDLNVSNTLVSHPIDYSLRNYLVYVILGVIGFDPVAMVLAVPLVQISGIISHCGADIKGGFLNYIFVTPEVHRWHHAAETPQGHRYAVNYGVEFSFWDILFGTFHLPVENGETLQPRRLGHPGGLPDEGNYARLLLKPLGLWPASWGDRKPQQIPAE